MYDVPKYNLKASEYGTNTKQSISGHFEIPSTQYHYHMETQQCLCVPNEGEMDVYSSSQCSDTSQIAVSEVLNVPVNQLNFFVRRVGGAFGAKISRQGQVSTDHFNLIKGLLNKVNFLDCLCSCFGMLFEQKTSSFNNDNGRQHASNWETLLIDV